MVTVKADGIPVDHRFATAIATEYVDHGDVGRIRIRGNLPN